MWYLSGQIVHGPVVLFVNLFCLLVSSQKDYKEVSTSCVHVCVHFISLHYLLWFSVGSPLFAHSVTEKNAYWIL